MHKQNIQVLPTKETWIHGRVCILLYVSHTQSSPLPPIMTAFPTSLLPVPIENTTAHAFTHRTEKRKKKNSNRQHSVGHEKSQEPAQQKKKEGKVEVWMQSIAEKGTMYVSLFSSFFGDDERPSRGHRIQCSGQPSQTPSLHWKKELNHHITQTQIWLPKNSSQTFFPLSFYCSVGEHSAIS